MPQVIEQGDIFGRIGKNIGQGLSEQMERMQTAKQLENIPGWPKEVSDLVKTPQGYQYLPHVLPYIQDLRAKEAARTNRPTQEGISTNLPESEKLTKSGIDINSPNFLIPFSDQELRNKAADLSDKSSIPFSRALESVRSDEATRLSREGAYSAQRNEAKRLFDEGMQKVLQKAGPDTFLDVSGRGQEDFLQDVYQKMDEGKTAFNATKEVINDLERYADTKVNLIAEGNKSYFGRSRETTKEIIRGAQKEFEKVGRLEDMKVALKKHHNLSEDEAASFAYPVQKHADTFSVLESAPKIQRKGDIADYRKAKEGSEKLAKVIAKKLKSTESIQSMANFLGKKGYDKKAFIDEMRRQSNAGVFEPHKRQSDELLKSPALIAPLGDLFFNAFGGSK